MAAMQVSLIVILSMAATAYALDCLECVHIHHWSYDGLIKSSLDRFNFPDCGLSTVSKSTERVNLRKCASPGDRLVSRCAIIRGRASVKVDGQQSRDSAVGIDIVIRKCINVPENDEENFCEESDAVQSEYLRQALTSNQENIPIRPANVLQYKGETCFCADNQCVSAANNMVVSSVIFLCLVIGLIYTR